MSIQPVTIPRKPNAAEDQEKRPTSAILPVVALLVALALAAFLGAGDEARLTAGFIGAFSVLIVLWQPFWGLLLLVGLIYLRLEELIPSITGLRLTLLISVGTLIGTIGHMLAQKGSVVRNPFVGMLLGFAATACLSGFLNGYFGATVEEMMKLVLMALLVLNLVQTPDRYRSFVTALIVFTAYLAAFSIYRYFTGGALLEQGLERSQATGIFSDPNDLASGVVFGLGLTLARLPNCKSWSRLWYALMALVMVTAILLTNSRGAMISLAVVVFVAFLSLLKNKTAGIVVAVIALGALMVVAPGRMRSFDSQEESANSRFELWLDGLESLKEAPLTGLGFRQFADVNPEHLTAHNSFVLCFSELGLPGYFFWMGCLYYGFKRQSPDGERTELEPEIERDLFGARLALGGYLVAVFFLSRTYVQVTWLFIALAVAAQIATGAGASKYRFQPKELPRDLGRIAGLCAGSILFIKLVSHVLAK